MRLRDLVIHMWLHSGYPNCGYLQMTTPQKKLFCEVIGWEYDPLCPKLAEESEQGPESIPS